VTICLSTSFRTQSRVTERTNPEYRPQPFTGPRTAGWRLRKVRSSNPPGLRSFSHTYPGKPEQVQRVRADLGATLNGCPIADETILVASELAANAATHSTSRQPGGQFTVRAAICPGECVWVEVEDQGGIWAGHPPRDDRPHGLDIVRAIAGDDNWGIDGDATLGRVVWARLDWPGRAGVCGWPPGSGLPVQGPDHLSGGCSAVPS
jgi:anti-sigma regulatory factor (Ser/Thr protein kinase)